MLVSDYPFKVGERIFYPQYGCGTVIEASPNSVYVRFAKGYERPLSNKLPMRHATAEDELYDPYAIVWATEPLNENARLEELCHNIDTWAESVKHLDGRNCQDDVAYELFTREYIHGQLNGLMQQGLVVPQDVLNQLNEADAYFIANSKPLAEPDIEAIKNKVPRMGAVTLLDPKTFWYKYRWPKDSPQ